MSKISVDALNILAHLSSKGKGRAWVYANCKKGNVLPDELLDRRDEIEQILESNQSGFDGIISFHDSSFPKIRARVSAGDYPLCFFYRGDISLLNTKRIAVIGTRNTTHEIKMREERVVDALVERQMTIVSGLANGCDSIAHGRCVEKGGKTIAILPSPVWRVIPDSKIALAEEIVRSGGLLLSEYYTVAGKTELTPRYVRRDHLQAMLSDGVVLVASREDGGSRFAVNYAMENNIDCVAIYDVATDADDPMFALNRMVEKKRGEAGVIDAGDAKNSVDRFLERCFMPKNLFDF